MRAEAIRNQVLSVLKGRPFNPFVITLDSGQTVLIEHPENFAYHPAPQDSKALMHFGVLSEDVLLYSTFDAITSVGLLDRRPEEIAG